MAEPSISGHRGLTDPPPDRIGDSVAAWVSAAAARPVWSLVILGLLVLASLAAASRISLNTDTSKMLSPELPFQHRIDELDAAFPADANTLTIVVRADSADAADAAVDMLAIRLARETSTLDRVFAPSVDPYLVSHGLLYLDRDALDAWIARLGKASNLIAGLRADQTLDGFLRTLDSATVLAGETGDDNTVLDPLYAETAALLAADREGRVHDFVWGAALSGDAAGPVLRLITLVPKLDFTALEPAERALAAIRAAIDDLDPALAHQVEISVTGDAALRADELSSATATLGLSLGLSLLLVGLLLRMALGSFARAGLALGALAITLVLTAGYVGIAVGALNLISIAFVVLMVGIGIDFSIHFLTHFDEHAAESSDRRTALRRTGRAIGAAMVLSATTTALAFFAFATTDFVGIAQLGLIGGVGVLIALAVALTVLPAAVARWPGLAVGPRPRPLWRMSATLRRGIFWLAIAIGLGGFVLAPQNRFDADPMNLRNPASSSVQAYRWIEADPAQAPQHLSLLVADAAAARAAATMLARLPEVREVTWLGDLVPADQSAKLELIDLAYPSLEHAVSGAPANLADVSAAITPESLATRIAVRPGPAASVLAAELGAYAGRRTPERDAALTKSIFRYFPMLIERLRLQLGADEVTAEALPAPLRNHFVSADGRLRVEIAPASDLRDPAAMRAFVAAVAAVRPGAAGPPDQIVGASRAVAGAILEATGLAFAACLLLAWLIVRDPMRIVAILLPIVLAGAVTVGAGVLFDLPFNYANLLVLPLLIGAGIDSGIHFALRAGNRSGSVFDTSTPRAILYSALTTIAAFGTLGLSEHPGIASMGTLLAIALCATVGMTFAVTPTLVGWSGWRLRKTRPGG